MNEPETKLADPSELVELKEQCGQLRRQTTILLGGLIVLSFTFAFFVGFQFRRAGRELDAVRPQARQVVENSTKEEPTIAAFMTKLIEYSRTHPDFQPIISKYRLGTNVATRMNTNAALATPAPAK